MTTITRAPLTFWACGGDVLMRVAGAAPLFLTKTMAADLLDVLADELEAADAAGDKNTWADVGERSVQLLEACEEASSWNRASRDLPRAA